MNHTFGKVAARLQISDRTRLNAHRCLREVDQGRYYRQNAAATQSQVFRFQDQAFKSWAFALHACPRPSPELAAQSDAFRFCAAKLIAIELYVAATLIIENGMDPAKPWLGGLEGAFLRIRGIQMINAADFKGMT